ncbi:hypothetical protein YC2023_020072 [Brassica napus]
MISGISQILEISQSSDITSKWIVQENAKDKVWLQYKPTAVRPALTRCLPRCLT